MGDDPRAAGSRPARRPRRGGPTPRTRAPATYLEPRHPAVRLPGRGDPRRAASAPGSPPTPTRPPRTPRRPGRGPRRRPHAWPRPRTSRGRSRRPTPSVPAAARRAGPPRHRHRLRRRHDARRHPLQPPRPDPDRRPVPGDDRARRAGGTVVETFTGTLGPSVRAVVPVVADAGRVVGLVASVGRSPTSAREMTRQLPLLAGTTAGRRCWSRAAGSWLASRWLRRTTHDLGPAELSRMYEYYDAVLHAVREGLLLLDRAGRLQLVNDEAAGCSALPDDAVGRRVDELGPARRARRRARGRRQRGDEIFLTDDRVVVVNQAAGPLGRAGPGHGRHPARPHRAAGAGQRAGHGPRVRRGARARRPTRRPTSCRP